MEVAPAQLYQTASGHLYHAGRICIVMVGMPGRGKTYRAVALTRYLRWLGVKVRVFHLADYRRALMKSENIVPLEYFDRTKLSPENKKLRENVLKTCLDDIWAFYDSGGQVAVYDASNPQISDREHINRLCKEHQVETFFIESLITKKELLARNIGEIPVTSPDYEGSMTAAESLTHFMKLLELRISYYQPLEEKDLLYIKMINDSERFVVNGGRLGYLLNRLLLFLMNNRRRTGSYFFARAGTTDKIESPRDDNDLSKRGQQYAAVLADTLLEYIQNKNIDGAVSQMDSTTNLSRYADDAASATLELMAAMPLTPIPSRAPSPAQFSLMVWTSTRSKTVQTTLPFRKAQIATVHDPLLNQLNAGVAGLYPVSDWPSQFPSEWAAYLKDPYHHRFQRGESYQDVAIRLEPLIMELERVDGDILIIAHESVLRVLYGYFMNCPTEDIPHLSFPANEIVELVSRGHSKYANRIPIPGASPDGGVDIPAARQ